MTDTQGAGWYHQPGEPPTVQRWWNGSQWTDQRRVVDTEAARKKANRKAWLIGTLTLVVGGLIAVLYNLQL